MEKVIVLKIICGNFDSGFSVGLQVWHDCGGFPSVDKSGYLPPHLHLEGYYFNWQTRFCRLNSPNRGEELDWGFEDDLPEQVGGDDDLEACRKFAKLLEQNMKTWLLHTVDAGWQQIREKVVEELAENKGHVRIMIQADPQLWKMPWLEWDVFDNIKYPEVGIGFSPLEYQKPKPIARSDKQGAVVRILAVFGNNENIDLEPDKQAIAQLPDVELEPLNQPSAAEVIQKLRDKRGWDIFFFAGHSQTKGNEGIIYINERESLEIGQFKEALKEAIRQGLQLAIFNSCDGLGLAQKLAALQLPIAIVMKEPVPDQVAQCFLKEFLKEYAAGAYLYTAVRRSQKRLEEFLDFPGCTGLPIICQNPAEVPPTWEELRGRETKNFSIYEPMEVSNSVTIFRDREQPAPDQLTRSPVRRHQIVWRKLGRSLAVSFAIALFVLSAQWQGKLQSWELQAFDYLMRRLPVEDIDRRLLIVGADETDLSLYGNPLPDAILTEVLEKINRYKPAAIGLNIIRDQPVENKNYRGGHDNLINHINAYNNVALVCFIGNSLDNSTAPLPGLLEGNQQVGFLDVFDDRDFAPNNRLRRYLLYRSDNPVPEPTKCHTPYSLVWHLVERYLIHHHSIDLSLFHSDSKFNPVRIQTLANRSGGYQNLREYAKGNQILIRYRHTPDPNQIAHQITVRDLLEERHPFKPSRIEGKVVLIGVTAPTGQGSFSTPYGKINGLNIHAHVVSQILSSVEGELKGENKRPSIWWWPQWVNALWVLLWSSLGGMIVWLFPQPLQRWIALSGAILILYGICLWALTQGGWIPLIPPLLTLLTPTFCLTFYTFFKLKSFD
ncbi:CHASE2 domain-containing protein [Laspinema olomoucense]|uniref:CHASE2 domain-containing protein n=1 Tax=Laspinema olomoucense TaxID=3231600 RepID=UPI0021BA87D2|nr:CHASE2 domain-containing protein [Laspinema sp. D3d]MCT7973623.1 CHASE2 domain-containing protein [Laspinema sp. D3d]